MTRDEAAGILAELLADRARLWRSSHFDDTLEQREYTMLDVWKLIRERNIEGAPAFERVHGNHVVRLLGRATDGRNTRLVLGLRRVGPSTAITIIDIRGVR
jgi:hypothetical protein